MCQFQNKLVIKDVLLKCDTQKVDYDYMTMRHFEIAVNSLIREGVKNGYFTVTLTVRALTISKCENFDPFFSMEYDSMILKTHFISL